MPRPRQFDEDRALEAAMRTFWASGYEATSTQDLCEATGLGRSSIYNTFTSKHELFTRALARYLDRMTTAQLAVLDDETRPATQRIRTLFDRIIDNEVETRQGGRSLGCFTVNTTVELAGRDPETAAMLERDLARRLAALRSVVAAGQRNGDVTTNRDPRALADFLNAVIGGMRVAGRGGAGRGTLESIAESAMDALTRRPDD